MRAGQGTEVIFHTVKVNKPSPAEERNKKKKM